MNNRIEKVANDANRPATVLESVIDLREKIASLPLNSEQSPAARAMKAAADAVSFRPSSRPPMALLSVMDDGEETGQFIRLRALPFVIGRVEGDLTIAHDSQMSGRHVEIDRRLEHGKFNWFLKDLGSTNGTFLRVKSVVLEDGQIVLLGGRRYRFDLPGGAEQAPKSTACTTSRWQQVNAHALKQLLPRLVELTPTEDGQAYPLAGSDLWIGRDASKCAVVLDDPMVSLKHAHLTVDPQGRWCLENGMSVNGVWSQIKQMSLGTGAQFQCGEQRFAIKILK